MDTECKKQEHESGPSLLPTVKDKEAKNCILTTLMQLWRSASIITTKNSSLFTPTN
jgi:hypothetical protein